MTDVAISIIWISLISLFILGIYFWPKRGIIKGWTQRREIALRIHIEDALKHIHKSEGKNTTPTLQTIAGTLNITPNQAANLISQLENFGFVSIENGDISLTPIGREYAIRIIRAHRLWERHLAENTGYSQTEWHSQAEYHEHFISPELADTLAFELGNPTHDPHGDPIPTNTGDLVQHGGIPLSNLDIDQPAKIVHIEDEPSLIYDQIVAEGLQPGMNIRIIEKTAHRVRFWSNEEEHILAPLLANNISVAPVNQSVEVSQNNFPLSTLAIGQLGKIMYLSRNIRGVERRRLMDLGFLPGTSIETAMISPAGDPTAYSIRNTLIALRKEQADLIRISKF